MAEISRHRIEIIVGAVRNIYPLDTLRFDYAFWHRVERNDCIVQCFQPISRGTVFSAYKVLLCSITRLIMRQSRLI